MILYALHVCVCVCVCVVHRPPDVPVQDPIYVEADIERAVQNGPTYVEANSVVVKPSITPSTRYYCTVRTLKILKH